MSDGKDYDGDYEVGYRKPPKEHRFKPGGKSPNERGRPRTRTSLLVPGEMRRTVLRILDEEHEVSTPSGPRKITLFETLFRRVLTGAAKGNPTQLRYAMKIIPEALQGRVDAHKAVWLADVLQDIEESSEREQTPLEKESTRSQVKHAKKLY